MENNTSSPTILKVEGLTKYFGGLGAVQNFEMV